MWPFYLLILTLKLIGKRQNEISKIPNEECGLGEFETHRPYWTEGNWFWRENKISNICGLLYIVFILQKKKQMKIQKWFVQFIEMVLWIYQTFWMILSFLLRDFSLYDIPELGKNRHIHLKAILEKYATQEAA